MTVAKVAAIRRYIGLSSDTKPAPGAGSTFYETDTGLVYVRGDSAWHLIGRELPA